MASPDDVINANLLTNLPNGQSLSYIAAQKIVLLGTPRPPSDNRVAALASHPNTPWQFDDQARTGLVVKDAGKRELIILPDDGKGKSGRSEFEVCLGGYGYPMGAGKKDWKYSWPR